MGEMTIDSNQDFIRIDSCAVNLVADSHVTFHAEMKASSESSFCYGVDAGADLYATIDAPKEFSWALPNLPFPIVPIDDVQLFPTGGQPACIYPSKSEIVSMMKGTSRLCGLLEDHYQFRVARAGTPRANLRRGLKFTVPWCLAWTD